MVGSAKRTVGAREKHWRAGKAALIHFNASWDVAARSRTFYHQDAHGIASPVGDASLRIFRRASPAITHCFSFVSGCSAPRQRRLEARNAGPLPTQIFTERVPAQVKLRHPAVKIYTMTCTGGKRGIMAQTSERDGRFPPNILGCCASAWSFAAPARRASCRSSGSQALASTVFGPSPAA